MIKRKNRANALSRQVNRLDRKAGEWEMFSRRYSLARIVIFVLGGLGTWLAAVWLGGRAGWATFFVFLVIFLIVAFFHRRLLSWIEKAHILRGIIHSQLSRLNLDWESIPFRSQTNTQTRSSFEIDLDLKGQRSLQHLIDICVSAEGSQLLAEWLSQQDPNLDQALRRQQVVRELVPLTNLRHRFLLTFNLASKENMQGELLLRWLRENLPSHKLAWRLIAATLLVAANLILFIAFLTAAIPPYWLVSFGLYMAFYYFNIRDLSQFLEAVLQLDHELDKFWPLLRFLEKAPLVGRKHLAGLLEPLRVARGSPSDRLRTVKWITSGVGVRANPVISLLLNLLLPWDFFFAFLAARARQAIASDLPKWLEVLYNFEALTSLANFGYTNPDYTFPEIDPDATPVFQAKGLSHPLLTPAAKISNDFCTGSLGEIFIITGSNMAGKSTFVKSIGVNLCLAYAGGPVNADFLRTRPFRLHTCIKISDSITDGFSYFYAEVKCLKRLLERLQSPGYPLMYLVDEIFRGTNNRERLFGSRAYLRSMIGVQAIGFLATHDIELSSLAQESGLISNYHFRDKVEEGKLIFDYQIHPGPSPTTNALIIMQLEGLPVEQPGELKD